MEITHITSAHHRYSTRILYKECFSLARNGHKVSLIVADGKGPEEIQKVKILDAGARTTSRLKRITQTVWKVYKTSRSTNADIYHFHDPELLLVAWLLQRSGGKVVYDIHEDLPRQIQSKPWIPKSFRKIIGNLIELFENHIAKKLDGLVCATPTIAKRFENIHHNIVTVCNYPILNELAIPAEGRPKKEKAACYVGGISIARGLFEMVNAAEHFKGTLYLAGPISNKRDFDKAKALPGWEKVHYLNVLDREGVRNLLSKSMVGLVLLKPEPNYLNSLPIKMFEYMSASLPVVASDFPLWKNIIEGNKCGFCVNSGDSKAVAQAVNLLLENQEKAHVLGLQGAKAVKEKYSWEKEFGKLANFISTI